MNVIVSSSVNIKNKNQKEEIHHNYQLVSVGDEFDVSSVYNSLDKGHSNFFNNNKDNKKTNSGKLWKEMVEKELTFGRSKFATRLRELDKQSSSGLAQVLQKIDDSSSQTSDAVYGNAIDDQQMIEKFPDSITTNDPLSPEQKLRIHEAIQADGAVARGLSFWRKFLMGKDVFVDFKVKKDLPPVLVDAIDERLSLHPDISKYQNKLREIDDEVDIRKAIQNICDNLFGFGRAVLVMLFNEDKIPIRLVPLSSYKLGRVFIDKNTFEFLGVEYLEIPDKKNILLATDMIYFTVNDNNVTPNSRYYGKSQIFSVLSVAENNLINRERNFPEIIRKRWAATLLVKTATRSNVRNQAIANQINDHAGGSVVIPDLVSAENIKIDTELASLIEFAKESDQKIFRDMELPNTAGGFLEISNTSEAQSELHVWAESTLDDMRENITDILVKQWYNRNLRKILERDVIDNGVETSFTPPPVFDPDAERMALEQEKREKTEEEAQNIQQTSETPENIPEQTGQTEQTAEAEQVPKSIQDITQSSQRPDEQLTLLESLGFDINALFAQKPELPSDEDLQKMVIQKLANITSDIYQDIIEPTVEDIISLTKEIKFPFKIFLKFTNIIFDTFLDRSAGVLGIRSSNIIDDDIALELMKLEKYIPKMRKIRAEKERIVIESLKGKLAKQAEQINSMGGFGNQAINGRPPAVAASETEGEQIEKEVAEQTTSNPTNTGIAAANKVNNRIASRINRGRVSK